MICPFRLKTTEHIIKPLNIITVDGTVTLMKVVNEEFAECCETECPFYNEWNECHCNRVQGEDDL